MSKRIVHVSALFLFGWTFVLIAGPAGTRDLNAQPSTAGDGEPAKLKGEAQNIRARTRRIRKLTRMALERLDRSSFDTQALLRDVGTKPGALFSWVRDRTEWYPYHGALRGARGVLMDHLGNSLDRSLLLAELLERAGYTVRLVRGTLSEDQVKTLLSTERKEAPAPATEREQDRDSSQLNRLSEVIGASVDRLRSHISKKKSAALKRTEALLRTTDWQSNELLQALSSVRNPDQEGTTAGAKRKQAASVHWWVEYRTSTENPWIDLDPAHRGMKPGDTLVEPENTVGPADLPKKRFQRVTVRILAEQWKSGSLNTKTVLEHTFRPARLEGASIRLLHVPMNLSGNRRQLIGPEGEKRLRKLLGKQDEWMPMFKVKGEKIYQASVKASGVLNKNPISKDPATEEKVKSATKALGGLGGGGGGGDRNESKGHLTAEWVEYVIRVPGRQPRTVRRPVFDLIGPGKRGTKNVSFEMTERRKRVRSAGLTLRQDLLLQSGWLTPEFVQYLKLTRRMRAISPLGRMITGYLDGERKHLEKQLSGIPSFPMNLYLFSLIRYQPDVSRDTAIIRPNVLTTLNGMKVDDNGELIGKAGLDIVTNPISPEPGGKSGEPFQTRVRQGVLDTVAEAMVLDTPDGRPGTNTSTALKASKMRGLTWTLVEKPSDLKSLEGRIDPAMERHLRSDLNDGAVVYAPEPAEGGTIPYRAWFRVDRETGRTLGMAGKGRGQTFSEYEQTLISVSGDLVTVLSAVVGHIKCAQNKEGIAAACCMVKNHLNAMAGIGLGKVLSGGFAFAVVGKVGDNAAKAAGGLAELTFGAGTFGLGADYFGGMCP